MKQNKALVIEFVIGILLAGAGLAMQIDYYSTMVFAMGCGLAGGAGHNMVRILYWTRPERRADYEERKREERIDRLDERKQYMRMKAGQVSMQIMLCVLLLLDLVLALFRVQTWVIGMIALLFLLLCTSYNAVYRLLEKRM